MWDQFTERARRIIALSQDEALRLRTRYLGTEHLLLGLLLESDTNPGGESVATASSRVWVSICLASVKPSHRSWRFAHRLTRRLTAANCV
jgi:hypothetical protein